MALSQFLVRNRHQNIWYGRVVVPLELRAQFNGKRELRKSLGTTDKRIAKRQATAFWLECQLGFERLSGEAVEPPVFETTPDFTTWVSGRPSNVSPIKKINRFLEGQHELNRLDYRDPLGHTHIINFGDPDKEQAMALKLQERAEALLERYAENPEMLDRLFRVENAQPIVPEGEKLAENQTSITEAIDLYITKLITQGRKGKKLSQRTLLGYQGRLEFWKAAFGDHKVSHITLKELSAIQDWLTRLAPNYSKKGISTRAAIEQAKGEQPGGVSISDKTRVEYLGQLKGFLEYAFSSGIIQSDLASHVEIPNAKQSKTVERLPFSNDDMVKIFPGKDYGVDFGRKASGFSEDAKFWIPLMAAYTGARLEEICQLTVNDIKTDKATGIIYADITDTGIAADGQRKKAKTKTSVRPIPLHSALLNIGLMDYVEKRKKDKSDKALFQLKRDNQGRLGKGFSNWFARNEDRGKGRVALGYIERRGVKSKGVTEGQRWTKTFHSFRHSAIDNLRDNKKLPNGEYIMENHIGLVMGHTGEKLETANYGANRSQLELRKDVIEAIDYTGLDTRSFRWN